MRSSSRVSAADCHYSASCAADAGVARGAPSAPDTASIPESERKSKKGNKEKKTQPHRNSAMQLELKDSSYYWLRNIPAHLTEPLASPRLLPSQLPSQLRCGCTAPPHTAHYSHQSRFPHQNGETQVMRKY